MIAGVNLDYRSPVGSPPAIALAGFRYARFQYDVSQGVGALDFDAARRFYAPKIAALTAEGITPIVALTHRTWGEGRGFDWNRMSAVDWSRYVAGLLEAIRAVAQQHAGHGIVWQIGNEHDQASEASIYMPPRVYGELFNRAYTSIRAIDGTASVITMGHISGPGRGLAYFRAAGIVKCSGVAFHPYGAGAGGKFDQFAPIEAQLSAWEALGLPLWVTEFGVLDRPDAAVGEVAAYAGAFMDACDKRVEAACWYGWADGMHNGYGVVSSGKVRQPLFRALVGAAPEPVQCEYFAVCGLWATLNVRERPSVSAPIVGALINGSRIKPLGGVIDDGGHRWAEVELESGVRGWASSRAAGVLGVEL